MQAFHILRDQGIAAPFILFSGTIGEQRVVECLKEGITDFLFEENIDRIGGVVERALRDHELKQQGDRLQRQLRESDSFYRALFDHNLTGIMRTNWEGEIVACNYAAAKIFGYDSADELVSRTVTSLYLDPGGPTRLLEHLRKHGSINNWELRARRKDGSEARVLLNLLLVLDEISGERYLHGTVVDVTEISRLQQQMQKRDKLDTVDKIAGGLAHDLNNLLMIIGCNSELLAEAMDRQHSAAHRYVENMQRATEKGRQLTTQLLAFSRRQVLQPQVLDLNDLLRQHINMLRPMIGDDIQLLIRPGRELPRIKADPTQIEQIILNLAVNARDAMPAGGRMELATFRRVISDNQRSWVTPGTYAVLTVEDNGIGMDEQTRARALEPFFTTKEPGRGTGLGLSVVYGVVKQAGGFVEVQSEPNKGSMFSIYIPETLETRMESEEKPNAALRSLEKVSILLVEDDDNLCTLLSDFLVGHGHKVTSAKIGADALSHLDAGKSFDILLTDVMMPGLSGPSLANEIRKRIPTVEVVYMSGYSSDRLEKSLPADGSIRFLQKPFALESLQAAITAITSHRQQNAPEYPASSDRRPKTVLG
jgi:PAS domain S-box-containing protein